MENTILRPEHEEFVKRMDAEHKRQNHRIEKLEHHVQQLDALTTSVGKLAASVESMVKEQEQQGERLGALEGRDGEMWRKVVGHVITAGISIILGFLAAKIGL